MIDEKKIKEAANTLYTGGKVLDANKKASFIRGVKWFKEAIWHDASEIATRFGCYSLPVARRTRWYGRWY